MRLSVWSAWDALMIISKREAYGWHLQLFLPSLRLWEASFLLSTLCGGMAVLFWNTMKSQDTVGKDYDFENCENMGASNYLVIISIAK